MYINTNKYSRPIGIGILSAFFLYGIGDTLLINNSSSLQLAGACFLLCNSIVVISVGWWMYKILSLSSSSLTALTYLLTRVGEGILLGGVGVIALFPLPVFPEPEVLYHSAMLILGLGSIVLCRLFYIKKLTPTWMAVWGIAGYASLAIASVASLMGIIEEESTTAMVLLIPGGIWEVTFAIWMLRKARK